MPSHLRGEQVAGHRRIGCEQRRQKHAPVRTKHTHTHTPHIRTQPSKLTKTKKSKRKQPGGRRKEHPSEKTYTKIHPTPLRKTQKNTETPLKTVPLHPPRYAPFSSSTTTPLPPRSKTTTPAPSWEMRKNNETPLKKNVPLHPPRYIPLSFSAPRPPPRLKKNVHVTDVDSDMEGVQDPVERRRGGHETRVDGSADGPA